MNRHLAALFVFLVAGCSIAMADVSTTTAITATRMGIYGWSFGLADSTTTLNTDLGYIAATGAGLFRFNADFWGSVETASGTFTFTKLVAAVNLATSTYGMDITMPMPISASWTPIGETCPQTDPYLGISVPCTHFPTNDMGLLYRFYKTVAQNTCGTKVKYEVWNEPDFSFYWKAALFPATTDYVLVATTAYAAIQDGCAGAEVILGPMSNSRGSLPATFKTHYTGNHYFSELLKNLAGNATNYTAFGVHIYPDSDGGGLDYYTAISSMVAMAAANGITSPAFHVNEIAKFGGSYSSSDHNSEEVWKSSSALEGFAILLSTPAVRRVVYHNLLNGDFSLLNSDRSSRYSYLVMLRLVKKLIGYTPRGDAGTGGVHDYKFTNGNSEIHIAWAQSGTANWSPSPQPVSVFKTNVLGVTTVMAGALFNPLILTTQPAFYEFTSQSFFLQGVSLRGVSLQ